MKTIFYSLLALLLLSCSTEKFEELDDINSNFTATVSSDQINNLSENFIADPVFDDSKLGIYHGIISTRNTEVKGELYVKIGNNADGFAMARLVDGTELKFTQNGLNNVYSNTSKLFFKGTRGSFVVDMSGDKVTVSNVFLEANEGYARIYKETSDGQVRIALGSFVDSIDPTFTGNWDLVAGPETYSTPLGDLPVIKEIVVTFNGNDFNGPLEPLQIWGYACIDGEMGELYPAMYDGLNVFSTATRATVAGKITEFSLISFDNEYRDPSGLTCDIDVTGFWARNGRFGTVTLD